jgi:predicted nucleic acid-binding Zn finger protein
MKATNIDDDTWEVLSDSGNNYKVTNSSCTCPNFYIRLKGKGSCKHMLFVQNMNAAKDKDATKDVLKYIQTKKATYTELEKIFGASVSDKLSILEKRGDIIHDKKTDTYMEM